MSTNSIPHQICVSGLGYVGLPTACLLAHTGYRVLGVDIDEQVVNRTKEAISAFAEPDLQPLLSHAVASGSLDASSRVTSAHVHIITVPTPLGPANQPDLSHVHAAVEAIHPHLRSKDLVIIESTCPIGTTDAIAKRLRTDHPNIYVAYCPERVLPGNILHEMVHNDRIAGGVDASSTARAAAFLASFVRGNILSTTARMAEAVKLAENSYRDINIAYANELSMIADRCELDVHEIIRLANRHPRVQILDPGSGVGGHCIPLDPWYLISSAPDLAPLISTARQVNANKTQWVIDKVKSAIEQTQALSVVCLGLTYKANVADLRESPALAIVDALKEKVKVLCVDPYVPNTLPLQEALTQAPVVVGLVAHQSFLHIPPEYLKGKVLLDFAGIFR